MTFAHVVAPKKAILSDLKSSKATKARRGGSEKSHFMKLLGRWGRNTPSVVFFALRAPELNSFQRLKILVWRSQKFCFRMRRNFSDTSLIWRDVRRASRWRRQIRRYKGSWDFPEARRFSPRCSPLCRCWFSLIDLLTVVILLSNEHSTGSSVFYTLISV